ncbi:UNVERIFIED_CONTAM: TEL2-interacting protein 1 [Siphonaria sp. JEL0065]|nr:TEL2-interacting protein 1 [Siphonaria sp. JEL0065]
MSPFTQQVRNLNWYTNTTTRIAQVVQKLLTPLKKTQGHPNYKVRLAYLHFSGTLLTTCRATLTVKDPITQHLLQCVAGFMRDGAEQVRTTCSELCTRIIHPVGDTPSLSSTSPIPKLSEFMTRLTFDLMSQEIPLALSGLDWDLKVSLLRLCSGYLICLGRDQETVKGLQDFQFTTEAVGVFLDSVLKSVAFENSNVKVIEDRDIGKSFLISLGDDVDAVKKAPSKPSSTHGSVAKYLDSNQPHAVLLGISSVFKLLAQYGNGELIFNRLISFFEDSSTSPASISVALFLMNEFCSGFNRTETSSPTEDRSFTNDSQSSILRSLVMVYLNSSVLPAPTTRRELKLQSLAVTTTRITATSTTASDNMIIKTVNTNVINTCLLLEGLAIASQTLSPSTFSSFLMDILYPILEKCGDTNRMVSETASTTLVIIAHSLGLPSVKQLLISNIDYLVNDLSLRLRYLNEYPNAPRVLIAALHVAGGNVLPFLDDAFEDVLMAIDFNQDSGGLLEVVFLALEKLVDVLSVVGGVEKETVTVKRAVGDASGVDGHVDHVSNELKEFEKWFAERVKRNAELDSEETAIPERDPFKPFGSSNTADETEQSNEELMQQRDKQDDDNVDDKDDTGKPLLTSAQRMAQKILLKAQHFLTRDDPHLQSLVLRLSAKSVHLLAQTPNTLNPIVHVLWPTVIKILGTSGSQHFVILDALLLISAFASVSKDFILKRFIQDLLPKLETVLSTFTFRPPTSSSNKRATAASSIIKKDLQTSLADPHSIVFKIIITCLNTLSSLLASIPVIQIPELSRITEAVWPFLENVQDDKLKDSAGRVIDAVVEKDPNHVWLKVEAVRNPVLKREGGKEGSKLKELSFPKYFRDRMVDGGVIYQVC